MRRGQGVWIHEKAKMKVRERRVLKPAPAVLLSLLRSLARGLGAGAGGDSALTAAYARARAASLRATEEFVRSGGGEGAAGRALMKGNLPTSKAAKRVDDLIARGHALQPLA